MAYALPDGSPHTSDEEESDNAGKVKEIDSKLEKKKKQLSQLLDTGFVIFIAHKSEELLQDLLADVIMWCPDYLLHLREYHQFNYLELKGQEPLKYRVSEWEGTLTTHGCFCSLDKHSGDVSVWLQTMPGFDKRMRELWTIELQPKIDSLVEFTYWNYKNCVKKVINGMVEERASKHINILITKINDIRQGSQDIRSKIDDILDVFTLPLGELIKEVELCHKHLKNSVKRVQNKWVQNQDGAQNWLEIVDHVEGDLYQRLREISKIRNEIGHHGKSRPCFKLDGTKREELMESYNSITKSKLTMFSQVIS